MRFIKGMLKTCITNISLVNLEAAKLHKWGYRKWLKSENSNLGWMILKSYT